MTKLSWVTPQGSIANVGIGIPASVEILAVDSDNYGDAITYQLISGELPPGMSLSTIGIEPLLSNAPAAIISGTPEYSDPSNNYFTTQNYSFVIRARGGDGVSVLDGSFNIIVANQVNSDFTWITPAGDLGTVPNGNFYQLPLLVSETQYNNTVTFSFISGELPPGMQVVKTGFLQGVPTLLNAISVDKSETFKFTIRATNGQGHVRDRSFYLSVTNVYGPVVQPYAPTTYNLGSFFDGSYFKQQLTVTELNPNVAIAWSTVTGSLPPGVTLSSTGLLSGYIQPVSLVGPFGPAGFDGDLTDPASGAIVQSQEFDQAPYDFNQQSQTLNYSFTIQAFDGANYDLQDYIVGVVSRGGYTADNANITADNNYLTIDTTNIYVPVILNANVTTLPTARSGSYYAYKFDGYDFQGDPLTYTLSDTVGTFDAYILGRDAGFDYGSQDPETLRLTSDITVGGVGFDSFKAGGTSSTNLPGVILDAKSGWLYGQLSPQSSAYETYNFGVIVSKTTGNVTYSSNPVYFNLPVLGDVNNVIKWITPADLGTINNGSVSDITIQAVSAEGKALVYSLVDQVGVSIRLPQGLELVTDAVHSLALLSGRVSFEAFSIDDYATTFDNGSMTVDRVYRFMIEAATTDGSASTVQEFTLTLNIIDIEPYDNLYLRAMPAFDQRQIFNSVVNNTNIFVPELIYRPSDPWFGVAKDIEMLFLPGLKPSELATYAEAIVKNHYTKTYNFGSINTAVVLDSNYKVKYEVVYINIIDPELNGAGLGPAQEINLNSTIANPYIDNMGIDYKIIYPNTSINMIEQLVAGVGYYDRSSLPDWMTSNQLDSNDITKFSAPLGYTRAVVLAYTMPGAGKLIAYRLKNSGINFNNIDFTVDRYLLDDYYTNNFDIANNAYFKGRETTFDALPNKNIGELVATVNYAVTVPFDQINGRPVGYINGAGGIDGVTEYQTGDTLIFAQQENFLNSGPYDGWVNYTGAFIGDNILTPTVEGYGSTPFDPYTIVPGYIEASQSVFSITGNSQIHTYLLTNILSDPTQASVYVNDVLQTPGSYNLSSTKIEFVNAPANLIVSSGSAIITVYSAYNQQSFIGNGTDYIFTLANSVSNVTSVYVNNVLQTPGSYTVSASYPYTITFNTPPQLITTEYPPVIKISGANVVNERGGVWKINIVDGIVNLTPVLAVAPGQQIRVSLGNTYSGAIVYYNQNLSKGQSVPFYSIFKYQTSAFNRTTFNADSTRFFSSRDSYYQPGTQDKYVKFPQYGVFT